MQVEKALCELKQAPRAWYEKIDSYLVKLRFSRSYVDPNLYFKVEKDMPLSCTKRQNVSKFPKRVRLETSPPKNGNVNQNTN